MGTAILASITALALVAIFAVSRRVRERRHAGSRTVALRITEVCIERDLADGRSERATWPAVSEIEVVRTRVRTADGATEFALIAESGGDEPAGCLVPLGVGYDDAVVDRLVRLAGFSTARWSAALDGPVPSRTIVWQRTAGASGDVSRQ